MMMMMMVIKYQKLNTLTWAPHSCVRHDFFVSTDFISTKSKRGYSEKATKNNEPSDCIFIDL